MWRRLKNLWLSLTTYADLSPDLALRRQVNLALQHRPAYSLDDWYERFWQPQHISRPVVEFVYRQLPQYSGLQMEKVVPGDRLCDDLHLPLICWLDWELCLCDDFAQQLGIEVNDYLDSEQLVTVADLMGWLNQKLSLRVN
jgi:hypothetical protein